MNIHSLIWIEDAYNGITGNGTTTLCQFEQVCIFTILLWIVSAVSISYMLVWLNAFAQEFAPAVQERQQVFQQAFYVQVFTA